MRRKKAYRAQMPNMFAGSILDLEENTAYEVKLALSDSGNAPDLGALELGKPMAHYGPHS